MNEKLVLSACNFLIPEIAQVIKKGDYPEVQLISYPVNCSSNALNSSVVSDIASKSVSSTDIIVIGSFCHSPQKSEIKNSKDVRVVQLEQCFELILNPETIYHFVKQGYYIVSNGWLRTYERNIHDWGFDKASARSFFQESMKSILLLDTKIPGDYMPNLLALSEYMGLPYEIMPVGLSHCKKYIDSVVLNWRNENEQKKLSHKLSVISKQSADYKVIFNQLETLVLLTNENEIIQIAFELINILFAPSEIVYTLINNKQEESFEFKGFFNNTEFTPDNTFTIEIKQADEVLGNFEVKGLQFPQFKKKYEEMGVVISQIFGLAIANARRYTLTLIQSNKLKAIAFELQRINQSKDKFFTIIAHDLKGPFNALLGFSEILKDNIENGDYSKINDLSNYIYNTTNQTYNLLLNLLEWSRSQTGKIEFNPESVRLLELVEDILNLLMNQAEKKGITLTIEISENTTVFADKNMLETIIRNLVSNAIKFTPKDGKVCIKSFHQNEVTQISVTDSGIGISPENIRKLFSIDNNTTSCGTDNEKGTGLGLILCKEFIEKHHGEIWVESKLGIGSAFNITLPNV